MTRFLRIVSLVAVLFGVAIIVSFSDSHVSFAQTTTVPPSAEVMDEDEIRKFRRFLDDTNAEDFARRDRARRIMGRALPRALPKAAPWMIRGGLAGVAAGIWWHNGTMVYQAYRDGHTEQIAVEPEFRPAPGSMLGVRTLDGKVVATTVYERAVWEVGTGSSPTVSGRLEGYWIASGGVESYNRNACAVGQPGYLTSASAPPIGISPMGSKTLNGVSQCYAEPGGFTGFTRPISESFGPVSVSNIQQYNSRRYFLSQKVSDRAGQSSTTEEVKYGEPLPLSPGSRVVLTPDIYEVGGQKIVEEPGNGEKLTLTPEETNKIYNQIVADPEAPPYLVPDYPPEGPDDWPEPGPGVPDPDYDDPASDPDEDGVPNETDPDQDNDGVPNEDDPAPYSPTVPGGAPGGDPDFDGVPNENDPDDDADGIPDTEDDNPTVPDPNPDTDGDGEPDRNDQDDDNDGIPDQDDPDPTDDTPPTTLPYWHPYQDPDEDGDPNRTDRDDDGDESEDWEDDRPWSPEYPSDPDADTDDDGVPDPFDPWPGNPYAPYDPDLDTDEDGVPDFKDPEILDPRVPWSPSGPTDDPTIRRQPTNDPNAPWDPSNPPWRPSNPGDPNVPKNPSNPNVPKTPQTPQNPQDPSTPNVPKYPTSPNEPDDPTTEQTPDVPPSPPPGTCPVVKEPRFLIPPVDFGEKFPFSLIITAKDTLGQLIGTPRAPVFELPMIGTQDLSRFDSIMSVMRTVWLVVVGGILMPIMFYRLIKGGSDE